MIIGETFIAINRNTKKVFHELCLDHLIKCDLPHGIYDVKIQNHHDNGCQSISNTNMYLFSIHGNVSLCKRD